MLLYVVISFDSHIQTPTLRVSGHYLCVSGEERGLASVQQRHEARPTRGWQTSGSLPLSLALTAMVSLPQVLLDSVRSPHGLPVPPWMGSQSGHDLQGRHEDSLSPSSLACRSPCVSHGPEDLGKAREPLL